MSKRGISNILAERELTHGHFLRQAQIVSDFKGIMRAYIVWDEMLAPDQREALEEICKRIARILNGDPNYPDNWRDVEGYAKLIADRLEEKTE